MYTEETWHWKVINLITWTIRAVLQALHKAQMSDKDDEIPNTRADPVIGINPSPESADYGPDHYTICTAAYNDFGWLYI